MLFDYNFKRYNFRILIYVILLSGIGVMAIWSATNQDRSMIAKQIFGIILGLILAICLSLVDYTRLLSLHVLIMEPAWCFWLQYFLWDGLPVERPDG